MSEPKLSPEEVVERLRELRTQIPEFTNLTTKQAMSMRRVANLDPDFILATVSATGSSPTIQAALRHTPESLHVDIADAGRWSAVEDELRVMLSGVTGGTMVRRHRVGLTALLIYQL